MKEISAFSLISDLIQKTGISCILIGGFAVNFYKVTRQTADIDFLITKEDFNKISAFLAEAGYETISSQDAFSQLQSNQASLMDVDFMFVDDDTLAQIKKAGREIEISGKFFFIPSLDHLIALKLHAIRYNYKIRLTKDLPDIINLVRINKIDVNNAGFEELCLKYGTEDIYRKIVEAIA
jgi:hypothetical protein